MKKILSFTVLLFALVSNGQEVIKIQVNSSKKPCQSVAPMECLQIKHNQNAPWENFHDTIEGFSFEKGYLYDLEVSKSRKKETIPADAFSFNYKLIKVLSKKHMPLSDFQDKRMTVTKINGKEVNSTAIYLTIDSNGSIYGKSGCNNFNLSYSSYTGKSCIKTNLGIGTLMACDEATMNLEREFLNAIGKKKFKIKQNGSTVKFKNWWGKTVIEATIPTEQTLWSYIEKNKWKLIMLENVGKDYGKAFIQFNLAENKVNGNTGCNSFFGSFKTSENTISFQQLGSTRMACLDDTSTTEQKMLQYLNDAILQFDVADQTLNFYKNDRLVLMFSVEK